MPYFTGISIIIQDVTCGYFSNFYVYNLIIGGFRCQNPGEFFL